MGKTELARARKNPFLRVETDRWECPKCGGRLFSIHETLPTTMDGNTVFHCEEHDDHTFWSNPRGARNTLYFNERATDSDFSYSEVYEFKEGNWVKQESEKVEGEVDQEMIDKWEPTGLLVGIPDPSVKSWVAHMFENAARHLVAMNLVTSTANYDFLVFPIIRRLISINGLRPIVNFRDLCREIDRQWEAVGGKGIGQQEEEKEWKFIESFCDRNRGNFLST